MTHFRESSTLLYSPASLYASRNSITPQASVVTDQAIGKPNLTWSPAVSANNAETVTSLEKAENFLVSSDSRGVPSVMWQHVADRHRQRLCVLPSADGMDAVCVISPLVSTRCALHHSTAQRWWCSPANNVLWFAAERERPIQVINAFLGPQRFCSLTQDEWNRSTWGFGWAAWKMLCKQIIAGSWLGLSDSLCVTK